MTFPGCSLNSLNYLKHLFRVFSEWPKDNLKNYSPPPNNKPPPSPLPQWPFLECIKDLVKQHQLLSIFFLFVSQSLVRLLGNSLKCPKESLFLWLPLSHRAHYLCQPALEKEGTSVTWSNFSESRMPSKAKFGWLGKGSGEGHNREEGRNCKQSRGLAHSSWAFCGAGASLEAVKKVKSRGIF